ncbi:MAG: GGDEF domain-containing protein, partial [Lachnospiraceae bacterium]|nr:GGDEF domain-containing protein [Lachnospiraceae bacterium]
IYQGFNRKIWQRVMAKKSKSNIDTSNIVNVTQWIIPTAILFIYVLVTLYSFSSDMRNDAQYTVRQKISDYNDTLIISFNAKMEAACSVAGATAGVVSKRLEAGDDLGSIMNNVVALTLDSAYSSDAVIADASGKGVTLAGTEKTADNTAAVKKCLDDNAIIVSSPYERGGSWYVDICAPVPGSDGKPEYALVYAFMTDIFRDIPSSSKFDGRTCYALVASDGTVADVSGRELLVPGENIFDSENIKLDPGTGGRTKSNLSNRNSGYSSCTIAGEERVIVYDPAIYGGLSVASVVTRSYVENEIQSVYGNMESILIRIVVAMIAFFIAILAIHFANKAVNTKHNQTLQEKAETDLLTGLLNKMSTEQKVSDYLVEARAKGQSAILFLIDIDNFKKVNDTMGHAFGDELLSGLGLGLSTLFRATDIVGRIGGDEFLVLMRNINTDAETKKREADKLLTFFRDFKVGEYVQYRCTASIGGAVFSDDGGDFESLYKAADTAMYESKRHGKNRIAYYGEKLEGPVTELGRH